MSEPRPAHASDTSEPQDRSANFRILDASANRAREGLRVAEDAIRFGFNDQWLSRQCKEARHELSKTLSSLACHELLAASRSVHTDVGRSVQTATEYARGSLAEVAFANLSRAAEALRTLEEVAKLVRPGTAEHFEQQRYGVYTLAKAVQHLCRATDRLPIPSVYLLADLRDGLDTLLLRAGQAMAGGVGVIQLRDKQVSDRELLEAARSLRSITRDAGVLLIVNDRPDVALLAHADGVHVGQAELPVADVRTIVGPEMLIGVSTHSLEQARQAVLEGADYLGVGPVFPSQTKQFDRTVGLELVREVAGEIALPAFAIGGIDAENVAAVAEAGLRRVAVSQAIWRATDPQAAAQALCQILGNGPNAELP